MTAADPNTRRPRRLAEVRAEVDQLHDAMRVEMVREQHASEVTLLWQAARLINGAEWAKLHTCADRRGLTPLFWQHVQPYGEVRLDLGHRLTIGTPPAVGGEPLSTITHTL